MVRIDRMPKYKGKGKLITFDGVESCGKTTLLKFAEKYIKNKNLDVIASREPGGTRVSESIRTILLHQEYKITDRTELALYEAARSQYVMEFVIPHLEKGCIVLSDRFYDSTIAYQGFGRNISLKIIEKMNKFFSYDIEPDLTFIIDISVDVSFERMKKQFKIKDRLEKEAREFHEKVRQGYLWIAENFERCVLIDNSEKIEKTKEHIKYYLDELLEQ